MKKRIRGFLMAMVALVALAVPALAVDLDVASMMETGMGTLKSDVLSIIAVVLPVALGIFIIFFGVRRGIAMLRGVAK